MASSAVSTGIETVKTAVSSTVETVKGVVPTAISVSSGADTLVNPDESALISPTDKHAKDLLAKHLGSRPDRSELVEKNILKGTNVAPGLQAAQAELERAQLEDKLEGMLQARPTPEELVKEGILQPDEVPGAK